MADPGIILAILSAVFNGSFVAFAKLRSVAACELHPVLFNFYVTLGVFLSCFIAAPFFPMTLRTSGTPMIAYLATAEPAVASAAAKDGVLTGKFKPRLGST